MISGGSVVMEVLFPGEPHEMRSMYHLDKGDLIMTHYCSGGTQPHMRLSKTASTPDKLVFDFDGGTNFDVNKDSFIHNGEIRFLPDGRHGSELDVVDERKVRGRQSLLRPDPGEVAMGKVEDAIDKMIANLPEKTGKSMDQWMKIVGAQKLEKHGRWSLPEIEARRRPRLREPHRPFGGGRRRAVAW